jgi:F-type H+-transporting ATPase subunit gamma
MPGTHQDISEEIVFVKNLERLVSAYEEIAVMRIEKVRSNVLAARLFRQGLSDVFSEIHLSHQREIAIQLEKKKKRLISREAAVLLSTNTRLAGSITARVSQSFIKYTKEHDTDMVVLGQIGKEYLAQANIKSDSVTFFPLVQDQPSMEDLKPLVEHILGYQTVTIFFGHFENLVEQKPAKVELGSHQIMEELAQGQATKNRNIDSYIFEPSLDDIISFFNNQIFATLVKMTMSESWLSLLGSRITAMEQASGNVAKRVKGLEQDRRRAVRRLQNIKQRDRLSGISLWHNK